MTTRKARTLALPLRTLFNLGAIRDLTDGQLLERYATGGGEGAELAFAALVERHAAMVLRACRARLVDPHDAQDAAQAAFVVLVKKARTLWVRDSIGPWLHQVAVRTARHALAARRRRERLEGRTTTSEAYESPIQDGWERTLHEEVASLPERYRVAIVLCDLQGHSCEEAARRMGRPVGTIKCWRARGRDRLRLRLIRLGMAPASVLAAEIASGSATGRDASVAATVRAICDSMTAGTVPAPTLGLAKGVLKAMLISKLRSTAVAVLAFVLLAGGIGAVARGWTQDAPVEKAPPRVEAAKTAGDLRPPFPPVTDLTDTWPLSLREAIRIGLKNTGAVRVVPLPMDARRDAPFVIAPASPDADPLRFRSEVMAHVRSVAQQYWALHLARVQIWAAEKAIELGEGIVTREEAKRAADVGDPNNLAEAREQVERFKLDLIDKAANVVITERQLRNILGLPTTDDRRIVPMTAPIDAKITAEWDQALKAMMENQPDVVRERSIVRAPDTPEAERGEALKQVVHQATHTLARFALEIDSNHKLFTTAARLRTSAAARLDAQATFYDSGKVTIDRYLDSVNRYATSVSQEADFQGRYNTAIAALEEAKGTLLEHEGIVVAERREAAPPATIRRDAGLRPAAFRPASADPNAAPPPAAATVAGKTYSFQFSIGAGPRPFEVRGSFTVAPADATKP